MAAKRKRVVAEAVKWKVVGHPEHLVLVTQDNVALFFGVSVKQVQQWFGRGCPGRLQDGGYAIDAMVIWLRDRWKAEGVVGRPEEGADLMQWEIRQIAADAQIKELKLQKVREDLVERDQVERVAASTFRTLRLLLDNIPDKAAMCVPRQFRDSVRADVQEVVDNALRTTRRALSRGCDPDAADDLPDPVGDVLKWLADLPERVSIPERSAKARNRLRQRVGRLVEEIGGNLRSTLDLQDEAP